jgi:hypothetical protein
LPPLRHSTHQFRFRPDHRNHPKVPKMIFLPISGLTDNG